MRHLIKLLALFSFVAQAQYQLQELWTIEGAFNMPESATYDAKRDVIYVSNVNHYAKDNNGFISRVSSDGKRLDLKWLTGLHSPTGLTVVGDTLYAVDFDTLVIVDLTSGTITKRVQASDAENNPVLNDVTVSPSGDVFVTGSRSRSIYKLSDGKLSVWLHDQDKLKHANGLFAQNNIIHHGGSTWSTFDLSSKTIIEPLSEMGSGLVEIDGITQISEESFVVTLIDDERVWLLRSGKKPKPLTQDSVKGIDLQYVAKSNTLYVPRVGNTLSAYNLIHQ